MRLSKNLSFLALSLISGCAAAGELGENLDMRKLFKKAKVECVRERQNLPALDASVDALYEYGFYLEQTEDEANEEPAYRFYRIAAAHGHYKASSRLQQLLMAKSGENFDQAMALLETRIRQGVPYAFYEMGRYLEGNFEVKDDVVEAQNYYLQAARLGNPDAQLYVGLALSTVEGREDDAMRMVECAMEQGQGVAARTMGGYYKSEKKYPEALRAFQLAIKSGQSSAAFFLSMSFLTPSPSDEFRYLELEEDQERSRRYNKIGKFLHENYRLEPKVPDIDKIVPLPPSPLPKWDGTFKWVEDRKLIPVTPSTELIQQLSSAKGLDSSSGLPLSQVN